jgi:hypothetical protein
MSCIFMGKEGPTMQGRGPQAGRGWVVDVEEVVERGLVVEARIWE